jgi:hypothetical protein
VETCKRADPLVGLRRPDDDRGEKQGDDIGSADALTPNAKFKFPWWAWALEEFTVRVGRGEPEARHRFKLGLARHVDHVPLYPPRFDRLRWHPDLRSVYRKADEDERIVLYFVGGGYVYVLLLRFPLHTDDTKARLSRELEAAGSLRRRTGSVRRISGVSRRVPKSGRG